MAACLFRRVYVATHRKLRLKPSRRQRRPAVPLSSDYHPSRIRPHYNRKAQDKRAGVTAGLVQYYFPTLDDLFIALLRARSDRNLDRLVVALRTRPGELLRAVWEFNRDKTAAAGTEFLALANHRKNIRAEVALVTKRFRQAQLTALKEKWPQYGLLDDEFSPEMCIFLLEAIPRMMLLEDAVGVSTAHAQVLKFVNQYIDRIEPRPRMQKARKTTQRKLELGANR